MIDIVKDFFNNMFKIALMYITLVVGILVLGGIGILITRALYSGGLI